MGKELSKREALAEVGTTGLRQFGGIIQEELHRRLQGPNARRHFEQMVFNDSIAGASQYIIETFLTEARWRIEPAEPSDQARDAASFVEDVLDNMDHTWNDFLIELATSLYEGFAWFEKMYKLRDGRFVWESFAPRSQESIWRFELSDRGKLQGVWQQDVYAPSGAGEVFLPLEKSFHFRIRGIRNNPAGRLGGIFRHSFRDWFFATRLDELAATGAERDLVGYPVMEAPMELMSPDATAKQKTTRAKLENLVQRIRRDDREGAVIPSELDRDGKPTGFKLKLLAGGGTKGFPIEASIERHQKRQAQAVMTEFMMVGLDATGNRAVADNKTDMFSKGLSGFMGSICSAFNRQCIPQLMALNGIPKEMAPRLVHSELKAPPLGELAEFVAKLAAVGVLTSDEGLEAKMRDVAKLPQIGDASDRVE